MDNTLAKELISFINDSPSPFHVVKQLEMALKDRGFTALDLREKWILEKNNKYYTIINDSAIFAFDIGEGNIEEEGFKIIGSHTDSPGFRIKPAPEIKSNRYMKLNTESYGGPILYSWLDRPLSLAGRVLLKGDSPFKPEKILVDFKEPVAIIPSLAIHMNRNVNQGIEFNKQKDTLPLLGMIKDELEENHKMIRFIADYLNIDTDKILDFDLFLYPVEKASLAGIHKEFISAPKLDDLAMVHAGLKAMMNTKAKRGINIIFCFDNEEVGSSSKEGADSPTASYILERILLALGKSREDYFRALASSFMISADMAHAFHPNYEEKQDPTNRPLINGGPVIKLSANKEYASDGSTTAVFEQICKEAGVPVQYFVNRSDIKGGTTIGPIMARQLGISCIDVGNPILSMHSIRELGGVLDHKYIINAFEKYYSL